jgi:hypothetical protein
MHQVKENAMTSSTNLDQARALALDRIEQAERRYKFGIALFALFEAVLGLAFLFVMDFRERLHWLILLAAVLVYGIVVLCVVNLGNYVNQSTQILLRAIFASKTEGPAS